MNEAMLLELSRMSSNELRAFGALIVLAENGFIMADSDVEQWGKTNDDLIDTFDENDAGFDDLPVAIANHFRVSVALNVLVEHSILMPTVDLEGQIALRDSLEALYNQMDLLSEREDN